LSRLGAVLACRNDSGRQHEVFVTARCVAVATRPDWVDNDLRDLPVEVWLEDDDDVDTLPDGALIHDGQITFAAGTSTWSRRSSCPSARDGSSTS
jgi:hypothetical protein